MADSAQTISNHHGWWMLMKNDLKRGKKKTRPKSKSPWGWCACSYILNDIPRWITILDTSIIQHTSVHSWITIRHVSITFDPHFPELTPHFQLLNPHVQQFQLTMFIHFLRFSQIFATSSTFAMPRGSRLSDARRPGPPLGVGWSWPWRMRYFSMILGSNM